MNLTSWKERISEQFGHEWEEIEVSGMPALSFANEQNPWLDYHLYPSSFLSLVEQTFTGIQIKNWEYHVFERSEGIEETLYMKCIPNHNEYLWRFMINHGEKDFVFIQSMNKTRDNYAKNQQKEIMFQFFLLGKDFLENHSPNRLWLVTNEYETSYEDWIEEMIEVKKERLQ